MPRDSLLEHYKGLLGHVMLNKKGYFDIIYAAEQFDRAFRTREVVVFLNPMTGQREAGPVTIRTYDTWSQRLLLSSKIFAPEGTAIYLHGWQDEINPPVV